MRNMVAPSILSADFSRMGEEVEMLEYCGADLIHCDVMDGSFVNPITFGAQMVKEIRKRTKLPLDVHLMIEHPQTQIENFARAGANTVTVHYEACYRIRKQYIKDTLYMIRAKGMRCGLVVNPSTPVEVVKPYLLLLDQVLLMSVVPGYGGKLFIPETLDKIRQLRSYILETGKEIDIEVDGGITESNVHSVLEAGANIIVAGSTVFNSPDKVVTIKRLRGENV